MVEGRIGRKEGSEGSIQSCGINRLGGRGPDLSTGIEWLSYSPRDTGALLRETGGTAGAQPLPMDMERLGFMEALL